MKFRVTPRFTRDLTSLPREHRALFEAMLPAFSDACDTFIETNGAAKWPTRMRVRPMAGARGIWELTWSFKQPDGRATFEFVREGDEVLVRLRRIGRHDIYGKP